MHRILIIILLSIVCFVQIARAQNLDSALSKYFFDADLSKRDISFIEYFVSNKLVSSIPDTSYSKFNLESEENSIQKFAFGFSKHPLFDFPYRNGKIVFASTRFSKNNFVFALALQLIFNTQSELELAYKTLKSQLIIYPSKKVELEGNLQFFEQILYKNEGKVGDLKLSKGKGECLYYINMYISH